MAFNLIAHINIAIIGYGLSSGYSFKLITALSVCFTISALIFFSARSKRQNKKECYNFSHNVNVYK